MNMNTSKTGRKAVEFAKSITGVDHWIVRNVSNTRAVLVHPGDEGAVKRAVFRQLRQTKKDWGGVKVTRGISDNQVRHDVTLSSKEGREVKMVWDTNRGRARLVICQRKPH